MTARCDLCESPLPPEDRIVTRRQRPSDKTDMCAIMWACESCTPIEPGVSMKEDDWDEWIESFHAQKLGIIFLT